MLAFKTNLEKLIVDKPKGYFDRIKGWFNKSENDKKILDVQLDLKDGIPPRLVFEDGNNWAIT